MPVTKRKSADLDAPIWFDGTNINEALFCDEFLNSRKIIFANGAFFTPDGRVTDDLPLRGEIYEKLKCCAVNNIPRKITNILEVMKLAAHVEDFAPEDRQNPSGKRHFDSWTAVSPRADRPLYGADCRWHTALTHRLPFGGFPFWMDFFTRRIFPPCRSSSVIA